MRTQQDQFINSYMKKVYKAVDETSEYNLIVEAYNKVISGIVHVNTSEFIKMSNLTTAFYRINRDADIVKRG
jgi:hypothetical protein